MKCETVMKKLPQRSKGRRPKRSIVHKLVLTPTSFLISIHTLSSAGLDGLTWVMLSIPDIISCILWFNPIVPNKVGE